MELINKIILFGQSPALNAWAVFLLLCCEFWLGKTEMVKAGSTVEVVLLAVKKCLDFVKGI